MNHLTKVIYWTLVAATIVGIAIAALLMNWWLAFAIAGISVLFLVLPRFPKGRYFLRQGSPEANYRETCEVIYVRALREIRDNAVSVPECKQLADDALKRKNFKIVYDEVMHS